MFGSRQKDHLLLDAIFTVLWEDCERHTEFFQVLINVVFLLSAMWAELKM